MSDFEYNKRDTKEVYAALLSYKEAESQALGVGLLGLFGSFYMIPKRLTVPKPLLGFTSFMVGAVFYNSWISAERNNYMKIAANANSRASAQLNTIMNVQH
ncbi:hypothetical protein PPERSA_05180 [Pseudocohnilembus persalinus]|uniref:Uncharacterized protein n=1 Tax=Pseudocohnilembus persalinus TaxID=266149 RepID=A0A0V0R9A7_PSEPJ|nr:hypothetical protein PPERSA_05180 [Pseudocohnilembus persalinus]|eukprot:KRX11071.1 hypothetical protein PPERSA_05180 [Pseudocohnilembus persalinus]